MDQLAILNVALKRKDQDPLNILASSNVNTKDRNLNTSTTCKLFKLKTQNEQISWKVKKEEEASLVCQTT